MATLASDAERMDRHYRYQRHIYDATRTRYLIGRQHLIADLAPPRGGSALEIGCGTAWNLVRIAKRYPACTLYGIDVSRAMLDTAEASVERHGFGDRVILRQGDATAFSGEELFGIAGLDRVVCSYALSMIPGWRKALDRAAGHVAAGGSLHIVDFGQCEQLPAAFKRALFAFLAHYTVYPRPDLEDEASRVAARHGLSLRFDRIQRGYTQYAVLSRP